MEKHERGPLLADKEEAENNIEHIKKQLTDFANIWEKLAKEIINNPENIIFSDAPDKLGIISTTMGLSDAPSFNWDTIPKLEIIAKLIQDLRREQSQLESVQRKLR